MNTEQQPSVTGELVVLNGKKRGSNIKLRLPITLIGSSEQCDVKITGPGIIDTHAIITQTAVGPVLRTFHPDQTLVNGVIVSTRLLKNHDEITVGPCVFRLEWTEESLIPLSVAPPEQDQPIALWVATDEADWNWTERAEALQAQEQYLAQLHQERQTHLTSLVQELALRREEIRQFRSRELAQVAQSKTVIDEKQQHAQRLAQKARQDRLRARGLYQRFLKRLKRKRATQEAQLRQQHETLNQREQQLQRELANYKQERVRREAEAAAYHQRLQQGWDLLTEGQRRLLSDRQAVEQANHRQKSALETREAELAYRQGIAAQGQTRVETRVQELLEEIQRLEQRAGVSRQVVQKLEERRTELEGSLGESPTRSDWARVHPITDVVPLNPSQDRGVEEFLTSLAMQEQDLSRNRQELVYVKQELEQRAAQLHDQRVVVAEQLTELLLARQSWQSAQVLALQELEEIARQLDDRERLLELRHNEFELLDQARRRREDDLLQLREKLDTWQLQLSTHEAELATTRAAQEAEWQAKHEHLVNWEATLAGWQQDVVKQWQDAVQPLEVETQRWREAREQLGRAQAETEQLRAKLLQDAARLGERALALEQAEQELFGTVVGKLAERRVRVFRTYWERHFHQAYQQIQAERQAWDTIDRQATAKLQQLMAERLQLANAQRQVLEAQQQVERDRLTQERVQDEAAKVLSLSEARVARTQQELNRVRAEVDQFAANFVEQQYTSLPGWGQNRAA